MFCGKCGAKNDDNALFCGGCGAKLKDTPVVNPTPTANPVPVTPTPMENKEAHTANTQHKTVGIIAIVGVAVAVIAVIGILLSSLFGGGGGLFGRSPEKTVDICMNAIFNAEARNLLDIIPEKMIENACERNGQTRDDLVKQLDDISQYISEGYLVYGDFYGTPEFSYEIVEMTDIKDDSLDELKELYKESNVKVSAAKEVQVNIQVTTSIGNSDASTSYMTIIKVGNSWYLELNSCKR